MMQYSNQAEGVMGMDPSNTGSNDQVFYAGDHCLLASTYMDGIYNGNSVSSVVFDPSEELIWSVSKTGHMTGYYSWSMDRYISVDVVTGGELTQVLPGNSHVDHSVYALGRNALYYYNKYGRMKHAAHHERMSHLECISWVGGCGGDRFVVGGLQDSMLELDSTTGDLIRSYSVGQAGCVILRESQVGLCAANTLGRIMVVDRRTPDGLHRSIEAHSGQISDFAVQSDGYLVVTCGWSSRNGSLVLDRLLKVYDLRFNRALVPISVMLEPCFVRFVPGLNDRLLVASQNGHFQFLQWGETVPSSPVGQIMTMTYDRVSALDISLNSRCLVFGTESGNIQLYSLDCEPQFNPSSRPTEFADPPPSKGDWPEAQVSFSDREFAVSSLPFSLTAPPSSMAPAEALNLRQSARSEAKVAPLSSDWPDEMCAFEYRNMCPIEPELLASAQRTKGVLIARKPSHWGNVWSPYSKDTVSDADNAQSDFGNNPLASSGES